MPAQDRSQATPEESYGSYAHDTAQLQQRHTLSNHSVLRKKSKRLTVQTTIEITAQPTCTIVNGSF